MLLVRKKAERRGGRSAFLYYDGRTVSFCSRCIRFFS